MNTKVIKSALDIAMNTAHGARSVIIELTPRRVVVKRPGHLPVARLCH